MRPLTQDETTIFFEKLSKYIGDNIDQLLTRSDGLYCFRFHKDRVFYVNDKLMTVTNTIPRESIVSFGTCFGKFTKSKKFLLYITALSYLAPYAPYKLVVKQTSEQGFTYGHHILKSGLYSITDNTPQYQGLVVWSQSDIPLGFGLSAKSTAEMHVADPMNVVCFHQADVGQFIRHEDSLI